MFGAIIINGYFSNESILNQTGRLIEEFDKLGIKTELLKSNEVVSFLPENKFYEIKNGTLIPLKNYDFIVYLNKDRYQAENLERAGYRLFNKAQAIIDCDDKMLTYNKLSEKVSVPETISSPIMYGSSDDKNFLDTTESRLGYPIIVKNVYGSMGKEVYKADNRTELDELFNKLKFFPHLYQKAIMPLGTDIRVTVIGGKAVSAMRRTSMSDFRSNAALGGTCEKTELTDDLKDISELSAKILNLDYAGVDVLSDGVKNYVCEVNSNAFFKKSEEVTGVNIAGLYAGHIAKELSE